MKKLIGLFTAIALLSSTMCIAAEEQSVITTESETDTNVALKCESMLDHDVTNQITVVGSLRISRIPMVLPVIGQSFKSAVVIPTSEKATSNGDVSMRLEPEYVSGSAKAGDILVLSMYMRIAEGDDGYAEPYFQNKANTVLINCSSVKVTSEWKKYYFFAQSDSDLETIKVTTKVGKAGQITYFGDVQIDNYGSENDLETVKKYVLGDEYVQEGTDEVQVPTEKIKSLAEQSVAFVSGYSEAYVGFEETKIDSASTAVAPYISGSKMYLPVRFTVENCGGEVEWNEADNSMVIRKGDNEVYIGLNDEMWSFNGRRWRPAETVQFVDDRAFLSFDTLKEFMGNYGIYDSQKNICLFCSDQEQLDELEECDYKNLIYEKAVLSPVKSFDLELVHNKLKNEIGIPALLEKTDAVPQFKFIADYNSEVTYQVYHQNEKIGDEGSFSIDENFEKAVDISNIIGSLSDGEYRIDFDVMMGSKNMHDALYFYVRDEADFKSDDSKVVFMGDDGKLVYVPDYRGNRMPDYSGAGYKNGKEKIPDAPAVIEVKPSGGDDTEAIQAAIDYVSSLPARDDGIRGAVQLSKGVFQVSGMFTMATDGVVLRGSGNDNANAVDVFATGPVESYVKEHADTSGTIILLTTTIPETRMLDIGGTGGATAVKNTDSKITDNYVPTGANSFTVEDASSFAVGDDIIIEQTGNMAWVHEIGMDQIPPRTTVDANVKNNESSGINQWTEQTWKFERQITAVEGNKITIDIPVAGAIAEKWGGAKIYKYTDTGRVQNVGIENMRVVAAWTLNENNVDMTYHAGELVTIKNAKDIWIRNVTTEHLNLYNINISSSAKRITVEDFYDLVAPYTFYMGPDYESTGRTNYTTLVYVGRYGVYIAGQQVLVNRVHGTNLRHMVEYSSRAAGPNVTYDGESLTYFNQMGPHQYWSVAGLYDNVDGAIHIQNRLNMGSGHGWSGAWFTAWNCTDRLAVQKPPTAQNWAIGHIGEYSAGDYPQFEKGYWDLEGTQSNIKSIFLAQTYERYGQNGLDIIEDKVAYDYTIKEVPTELSPDSISVSGEPLKDFDKNVFLYTYITEYGGEEVPVVTATSDKYQIDIQQAKTLDEETTITVSSNGYSQKYRIQFRRGISPYFKITSSGDDGNVVENVADRDLLTRWSASGDGQWLMYEFNEPMEISQIGIAFYSGSARATTFTIQTSDDGKNFETVYDDTSSGVTDEIEKFTLKPFTAKYVRIVGHMNNLNYWNSISEIRFYGANGKELFAND